MESLRLNCRTNWLLVTLLSLAPGLLGQAQANEITIDFIAGQVAARSADGVTRVIAAGDRLAPGETVITAQGRAQIRFSDGGIVDLAPDGAFRIDDYAYAGAEDGSERKFMTLLRGFLRTISGTIGHAHFETYRLDTPVASIGIRGTGYTANLAQGLSVEVGEGAVEVVNQGGALRIERGQAGFVRDAQSPPVLTPKLNRLMPLVPQDGQGGKNDDPAKSDKDTDRRHASVDETAPTGRTPPVGLVRIAVGGGFAQPAELGLGTSTGGMVSGGENGTGGLGSGEVADGLGQASGDRQNPPDGGIGWTRWTAADGRSIVHVLTGTPSLNLPASGKATYTLDGGSGPLYAQSLIGGKAQGTLAVNFAGLRSSLGLDISLSMEDGAIYRLASTGGLTAPEKSQITLGSDGLFRGDHLGVTGTGSTNACGPDSCTGAVTGFFSGTAAERAALAYGIARLGLSNTTTISNAGGGLGDNGGGLYTGAGSGAGSGANTASGGELITGIATFTRNGIGTGATPNLSGVAAANSVRH
jgi:hypothetical protein